ncbi:MAG: uroporphyrinogen-III synthase, partial [Kofleriaceae bacterium]
MPYAIVTRDAGAAAPYAGALAALGFEVVAMPVTRSAPPSDPDALARSLARGGHAAIACASARAARAVLDARGGASLPEIWAVGPATARAFEQAGVAV